MKMYKVGWKGGQEKHFRTMPASSVLYTANHTMPIDVSESKIVRTLGLYTLNGPVWSRALTSFARMVNCASKEQQSLIPAAMHLSNALGDDYHIHCSQQNPTLVPPYIHMRYI
jgi:hypothetical protein